MAYHSQYDLKPDICNNSTFKSSYPDLYNRYCKSAIINVPPRLESSIEIMPKIVADTDKKDITKYLLFLGLAFVIISLIKGV